MKITYQEKPNIPIPTLDDLKTGDVFHITNSRNVFMRCDLCGESRLLSDCGSEIWGYTTLTGDEPFDDRDGFVENHDYDELIVCVNLASGGVTLFHCDIEVEPLDCELLAKED